MARPHLVRVLSGSRGGLSGSVFRPLMLEREFCGGWRSVKWREEFLKAGFLRSKKREAERRGSKGRFAVVTEADGDMKGEGESPPFMERPSGSPVKVGRIWSEGHRCSF